MNQAFQYTASHLSTPINIQNIVSTVFTSKTNLDRVFQKNLSLTPRQAMLRFKLEYAMVMLQQNIPIKTISEELGFSSVYHFSNTFKKLTGLRPSEYRDCTIDISLF